MTGAAQCHTATGALYGEFIRLANLHEVHIHIGGSFQLVGLAVAVYYGDDYVAVFGHVLMCF
jgi:hypothetical protein